MKKKFLRKETKLIQVGQRKLLKIKRNRKESKTSLKIWKFGWSLGNLDGVECIGDSM